MNTIEEFIEGIVKMLQKLDGAPALALVFVSCIVVGYSLRLVRKFPNDAIPLAVILWGGIIHPIIADAQNDTPLRIWMIRGVLVGSTTGFVAWLVHKVVLSKIEDRLGMFNKQKEPKDSDESNPNTTPRGGGASAAAA